MTHGFQNRTYGQQPVDQLKVQQAVAQNAPAKQASNIQQLVGQFIKNMI